MKKTVSLLFVITAICCAGCTASLVKRNAPIEKNNKGPVSGYTAVITDFQLISMNDDIYGTNNRYVDNIRKSAANAIYNSGYFSSLILPEDKERYVNPGNAIFFDIKVNVREVSSFNWTVTWPAVYPACAYWPIQQKRGDVVVSIEAELRRRERVLETVRAEGRAPFEILFYGFFRTSPVEAAGEQAYLYAFDNLKKEMQKLGPHMKNYIHREYQIESLAVLPFESDNISNNLNKLLTDKLCAGLTGLGQFNIIERAAMKEILKEQEFELSGCTTDACQIKIGRMLSVTHLMSGNIANIGNLFHISVRIINIRDGKIEAFVDRQYRGDIDMLITEGIPEIVQQIGVK